MNQDHGDAVQLIARWILVLEGKGWQLVGVDPESCDPRREASLAQADFGKGLERNYRYVWRERISARVRSGRRGGVGPP